MVLCKPIPTGRQHRMHLFSLRGSARTGRGPHAPAATPAVATEQRDTQTDPRILVKTRFSTDDITNLNSHRDKRTRHLLGSRSYIPHDLFKIPRRSSQS